MKWLPQETLQLLRLLCITYQRQCMQQAFCKQEQMVFGFAMDLRWMYTNGWTSSILSLGASQTLRLHFSKTFFLKSSLWTISITQSKPNSKFLTKKEFILTSLVCAEFWWTSTLLKIRPYSKLTVLLTVPRPQLWVFYKPIRQIQREKISLA